MKRVFPRFVNHLADMWRTTLPGVIRLEVPMGPLMPKASTFYAGTGNPFEVHVFLNLQQNSKSWNIGQFTLNVLLSEGFGPPKQRLSQTAEFQNGREGTYRAGSVLYAYDKWWCLLPADEDRRRRWRPTIFDDEAVVFREVTADLTADAMKLFRLLGHGTDQ
jgi:hypothetical protein